MPYWECEMSEELLTRVKQHITSVQHRAINFGPALNEDVDDTESKLGFRLPEVLRLIYTNIGNGGFGPGRGGCLIGVRGGFEGTLGTIVAEYEGMKDGAKYLGLEWPAGLLPFCDWGDNISSCVSCIENRGAMYIAENCHIRRQSYDLDGFMEMWVNGIDILGSEASETLSSEIVNPFTGRKTTIRSRKPK